MSRDEIPMATRHSPWHRKLLAPSPPAERTAPDKAIADFTRAQEGPQVRVRLLLSCQAEQRRGTSTMARD